MKNEEVHIPVLFNEVMDMLQIKKEGIYVDCTYGGGGHSNGILERLNESGRVIAFDQDDRVCDTSISDPRLILVHSNFRHIGRWLKFYKVLKIDGLVADLGMSSFHLAGEGGFSFQHTEQLLDMRMNTTGSLTATMVVMEYAEDRLWKLFEQNGEVRNARSLAKCIVEKRDMHPVVTVGDFLEMIRQCIRGNERRYIAKVFQALRMEVNQEIQSLTELLEQLTSCMEIGGRIAMISFHSIEDRLVKHFFKGTYQMKHEHVVEETSDWNIITKRPICATEEECRMNTKSRSAKLRVIEKK